MSKLSKWQAELKKYNKSKKTDPIFIITELTPADADILLEANDHNRVPKNYCINVYAESMENDKWVINGETIKVDKNGTLIDGQHRLMAMKLVDKPIRFAMALGVCRDYFDVTDTGRSRAPGDILKIAGIKNYNLNAATALLMLRYQMNESFSIRDPISPSSILQAVERWPHLLYYDNPSNIVSHIVRRSIAQFFMYITMGINEEAAYKFFEKLSNGADLRRNSPILMFRDLQLKYKAQHIRMDRRHIMASLIITWNAYYEGYAVKTVKWDGVLFPAITGVNRKKLFSNRSGIK